MRILKLVIWDLDETILTGILEEGDEEVNPEALRIIEQLDKRGVLQALATQNSPDIIPIAEAKFDWFKYFVHKEADWSPKARKIRRILSDLEINPLDTLFMDEDAFERDSITAQIQGISSWTLSELKSYLERADTSLTEESQLRPQMYREQKSRVEEQNASQDYEGFLRSCNIQISIRPYDAKDALRVRELLTRTHRMNLGVLPVEEAVERLNQTHKNHVIIAEIKDKYGDMGRSGVLHLRPSDEGSAAIASLAISCRTKARGLSLAMLVGLLRHPYARFQKYHCRYIFNGTNRPLRMLLTAAGFKADRGTDELTLSAERLRQVDLPEWITLSYLANPQ
jgi:FkbH-like protein